MEFKNQLTQIEIMKEKTKKELFDLLYKLEDYFDYDETDWGKEIGKLVNKLQNELIVKKINHEKSINSRKTTILYEIYHIQLENNRRKNKAI